MINKLPTKHIRLLIITCVVLAIVVAILPSGKDKPATPIQLQANLQIVDMSELNLSPTPQLSSNSALTLPTETIAEPQNLHGTEILALQSVPNTLHELPIPEGLQPKTEVEPSYSYDSETIKAGDSLSKILSNHGISAQDIYKVSQADKVKKELLKMRPDQVLEFEKQNESNLLTKLTLVKSKLEKIEFTRSGDQFTAQQILREPDIVQTYKEATIASSLFVDGLKQGIDQRILIEMANVFGWDIDFALDIREGDTFSLLYEEKYLDGEQIGLGNILAAQFINNGRTYQAIRFETKSSASYYTPDGLAMRKAFLRTPVEFTRISSKFNPNRIHPLFKTSRPHRGVDYAAPSGTPVKSAGDGKVSFAGKQNGYGNVVIVDHGKGYTTLYAHLKSFARGIRKGARVKQGQNIAYVGQTGWATGPHLHYEFRINGAHKNPVTVKLPNDDPMAKSDLQKYLPYAQRMMASLESYHSPYFQQKLASLKK